MNDEIGTPANLRLVHSGDVEPETNDYPNEGRLLQGLEDWTLEQTKPVEDEPLSPAAQTLYKAALLIDGDRNDQHGDRLACHSEIAKAWSWWKGVEFTPHDVAMMMSLLKTARMKTGDFNKDCYIDLCGYASIAGEFAEGKK